MYSVKCSRVIKQNKKSTCVQFCRQAPGFSWWLAEWCQPEPLGKSSSSLCCCRSQIAKVESKSFHNDYVTFNKLILLSKWYSWLYTLCKCGQSQPWGHAAWLSPWLRPVCQVCPLRQTEAGAQMCTQHSPSTKKSGRNNRHATVH